MDFSKNLTYLPTLNARLKSVPRAEDFADRSGKSQRRKRRFHTDCFLCTFFFLPNGKVLGRTVYFESMWVPDWFTPN